MISRLSKSALFATLPSPRRESSGAEIRRRLAAGKSRKLVVLDDDPTGTQTVYDVPVLATWDVAALQRELAENSACFYILTNSRSLSPADAACRNREIARNLREAVWKSHGFLSAPEHARELCRQTFTLVSRSDSTLRGHYPLETDVLTEELGPFDATILIPYFEAGGRYTSNDIHYVAADDMLIPAAETAFAADAVFGYRNSNLRDYVEEKTGGRVRAAQVISFSVPELRREGADGNRDESVLQKLLLLRGMAATAIVNACAVADAESFALASLQAEEAGGQYLFRTAAQFVSARLGLEPRPLWQAERASHTSNLTDSSGAAVGGLIVVGSYVPATTKQLKVLENSGRAALLTVDVEALLDDRGREQIIARLTIELESTYGRGKNVVLATTRQLITGATAAASLAIGNRVSAALVEIVRRLKTPPRYLIAKGGITASDLATKSLGMKRGLVRGQILPGVPVWELGAETKFPGLTYVVFPGNVGGPDALADAVHLLSVPSKT